MARLMLVLLGMLAVSGVTTVQAQDEPGGYSPIDVDSDEANKAAQIALYYLEETNSRKLVLVRIIKAEEQVVAGINVRVTIEVGETSCLKDSSVDCPLEINAENNQCTVVVYTPLNGDSEVTESSCDSPITKVNQIKETRIPGGYNPIDLDSDYAKKATIVAFSDLEQKETNKLKLLRVVDAEQQVVSGFNTKVTFEVGVTKCSKHRPEEHCSMDDYQTRRMCTAVVYTPLMQATIQLIESYCEGIVCDTKEAEIESQQRTIPGGETEVNAQNATVKKIAKFVLDTVDEQSNHLYTPKLDEILKARVQVVAGRDARRIQ